MESINFDKRSTNFVPTTSKASESDFGIVDLLVRIIPNAGVSTMLAQNRTV